MTTWAAVRELLGLAWRTDRHKLVRAVLLLGGGSVATPLIALGLSGLTDALLGWHGARATGIGVLLAGLLVLELTGMHFAHLSYFELGEEIQAQLQRRLFRAANQDVSLDRQEQAAYADELQVAQSQAWNIDLSLEAILQVAGLVVQVVFSTVLLARLNPALPRVPALAGVLVVTSSRAQRAVDRAQ